MRTTIPEGDRALELAPGGRWRWLGHPTFLACVLVLAVNDHLLKSWYPGWWTGKLSDVVGVAVVATVAAAVIGPSRGVAAAGIGFVLLKAVPGVAELASPFLGGVTLRDPTDLLALAVLVPLLFWLSKRDRGEPGRWTGLARREPSAVVHRARAVGSAVVPTIGVVAAIGVTTATGCGPAPAVTNVIADGGSFYALVSDGPTDPRWARSNDGGRSWEASEPPQGAPLVAIPDMFEDPGATGPQEVCAADGTCWRLRDRRIIERRATDGAWVVERRLTDAEFSSISTGCAGAHVGVLSSIAVIDDDPQVDVVVSLGADGVLARSEGGSWSRHRVLSAPPVEPTSSQSSAAVAAFAYGPIAALALWLFGRERWVSWRGGLVVIGVGWLVTILTSRAFELLAENAVESPRISSRIAVIGMVVTTAIAIAVARRPSRRPTSSPPDHA